MQTITEESKKVKVEIPALTYRFKVRISGDDDGRFTNHIHNVSIDYINDTVSLTVGQPANDTGFHTFVYNLCKNTIRLAIDYVDGGHNAVSTVEFFPCNVESHLFELSYGNSEPALHKIKLKFKGFYNV